MLDSKEFYTTRELAQELRVTEMTIYRMVKRGQLPCIDFGRMKRFSGREVLDFINRFKKGPLPSIPQANHAALELETDDQTWFNADASKLAEYGSYSWKPGEIEKGKPVRFVAGKGFLIED